jgi:Uma2 family endonuclease
VRFALPDSLAQLNHESMNAPAKQKMTVDEFLAWAEGREGRWELADGVPVRMPPRRVIDGETKFAAAKALEAALAAANSPCRMLYGGVAVRLDESSACVPDVIIYCGERLRGDAMEVRNPAVAVEVLSPSIRQADLLLKVRR